jgi:hypothetical protein
MGGRLLEGRPWRERLRIANSLRIASFPCAPAAAGLLGIPKHFQFGQRFIVAGGSALDGENGVRAALFLNRSKCLAKAWECAARAQVVQDHEQRAELLRFSSLWLSLAEPVKEEPRGAYELAPSGK